MPLLNTNALRVLLLVGGFQQHTRVIAHSFRNDSKIIAPAAQTVDASVTKLKVDYFSFESTQLTADALANLTSLNPNVATLFNFDNRSASTGIPKVACKLLPGDETWPSATEWSLLNLLLGGALIQSVPAAAVCYPEWPQYDAAKCADVTASWNLPQFQADDPTGIDFPLFEGVTCVPPSDAHPDANCTLGGYPSYVVNVTTVAQIQLAVNFARNRNLRLTIKNKGHDFNAKNTGAGALSIWTHHLNDIRYIQNYTSGGYSGAAFKIGAGVETIHMYETADALNLTIVGGIARTVGLGGGYIAGGGHSPLSSKYGMAADQVLGLEVVLPNGTFISADKNNNPDLFWALRGGGGSTYGIVTSLVIRAYPKLPVSTLTYSFSTSASVSNTTFWAGIDAFFATFPAHADAGLYSYFTLSCANASTCSLAVHPVWANNMTTADLQALTAPYFARLAALAIPVQNPLYTTHPGGLLPAFEATFPAATEVVGTWTYHTGSRLFPRSNWADARALAAQTAAVRAAVLAAGTMLGYNIRAAANPLVADRDDNAVNPAWRHALFHALLGAVWPADAAPEAIAAANGRLAGWLRTWRDVSPGAGAYLNEADVNEPDFQASFYGVRNYGRLYALKREVDPWGLLYAPTAVGSEDWVVEGQIEYYPTQNGRLCPREG